MRLKFILGHCLTCSTKVQQCVNLFKFEVCYINDYVTNRYNVEFDLAKNKPEEFWAKQASQISWFKKWNTVLDNSQTPFTKWFEGGQLNACFNCLDRHCIDGFGMQRALIWDSPITQQKQVYSYSELLNQVKRFAGAMNAHGVQSGDRVLIYMPMVPQAVVAMLACARIGAIHSVVFGGFAAKELAIRISHCSPKAIITSSAGVEPNRVLDYQPIVNQAIELASTAAPKLVFIHRRPNLGKVHLSAGRDFDWSEAIDTAAPFEECVPVDAMHPLYILYTSGTTGTPKGIVRPTGGYSVVLPWSLQFVYGMHPGETWWASSDFGWVVGHSYICYGPLLRRLTTIIYEGKPVGTPDSTQFFRVISEHDVRGFFCAPTALRAIRQKDFEMVLGSEYRSKQWNLRNLFSAGEHLDYETRRWAEDKFGVPCLDHWWQTESGWPMTATCVGALDHELNPPKDASGRPVPGWNVQVVDGEGQPLHPGQLGSIVVKLPLPPGCLSTLWLNDSKFKETYFDKDFQYYHSMDAGSSTCDGHICVMSRVDDVINVAGHRLSSGALEEALLEHCQLTDCAVVAFNDSLKGGVPVAFCVLRDDTTADKSELIADLKKLVRYQVGAVASIKSIIFVPRLPKTRSGKIARNTLCALLNNKPFQIPQTIEDASVYDQISAVLRDIKLTT